MAGAREVTPRERVAAECARRGRPAVVRGCVGILDGTDIDDDLVVVLGGAPAENVLGGREGGRNGYWPRVWAARGLLHAFDDSAAPAVISALDDPSWRVREMALKVIARHHVGDGLDAAVAAGDDPVERVRVASARAVAVLTAAAA